jgi:hypothetical protein
MASLTKQARIFEGLLPKATFTAMVLLIVLHAVFTGDWVTSFVICVLLFLLLSVGRTIHLIGVSRHAGKATEQN